MKIVFLFLTISLLTSSVHADNPKIQEIAGKHFNKKDYENVICTTYPDKQGYYQCDLKIAGEHIKSALCKTSGKCKDK